MQKQERWNRLEYDNAHCEMPRADPLWRSRLTIGQIDDMFEKIKQACLEEKRASKSKDFLTHWGERARAAQASYDKWLNDYCNQLQKPQKRED